MFASTRDFHDAKQAWRRALPKITAYTEAEMVPEAPTIYLDDLDGVFLGKHGTFLPHGTVFYHSRQVINGGPLVGYIKLLKPHVGAMFIALDDLSAIAAGGYCLTKSMTMQILPQFELKNQDFYFISRVELKDIPGGHEITAKFEVKDSGKLVVTSHAVFVRTETIVNQMMSQIANGKDDLEKSFRSAPLRIAGEHANDVKMSFKITVPRPTLDALPPWWQGDSSAIERKDPMKSVFEGRFELYSVENTAEGGVRAVVWPQLTAEGPPSLFHGGGGVSSCIEVLRQHIPDLQLGTVQVRFKRPCYVGHKYSVEWQPSSNEPKVWKAQVLDWKRNVMQELVLTEAQTQAKI